MPPTGREYNNHQTGDAPGAVQFNLDPLWSDSNIDFVGIDNYLPLADWRDGTAHLDYDAVNGPTSHARPPPILPANIEGGEDYDWYYASDADRAAQTRTPITDGAYGKPWVFRAKDFWNWWANAHYDRADGSESPARRPAGCRSASRSGSPSSAVPAVDKGANQPNVFFDPKSSESALPYFSNGERDDLIQRRFLEAHLNYWTDAREQPHVRRLCRRRWSTRPTSTLWSLGCAAVPVLPRAQPMCGAMPGITGWAIG